MDRRVTALEQESLEKVREREIRLTLNIKSFFVSQNNVTIVKTHIYAHRDIVLLSLLITLRKK